MLYAMVYKAMKKNRGFTNFKEGKKQLQVEISQSVI